MTDPDRLSGLDASFLALEEGGALMHVGSCMVFEGRAPSYAEVLVQLERRVPLVPRYRQKLAFPPLGLARPVWVDDAHFNLRYHVRHTALPPPAGEDELRRLAGRVFSQRLDRAKPLWELWLVDGVDEDRFAVISKTHHCLVDGISGVDIATVIFDTEPEPPAAPAPGVWEPRPEAARSALLASAASELAAVPAGLARGLGSALAHPRRAVAASASAAAGLGAFGLAGLSPAPRSPLNVRVGPHRRFAWVDGDLAVFKAIKQALGGTVNDVVLAVVAGALRAHLQRHGEAVTGVELKALVPVSVRADTERGALGNRVAAVYAPLPVGVADPIGRFRAVHDAMRWLKGSGQAVGAERIAALAGFASPTVLSQAARLQGRQRLFNLTVTNVPGPQFPLYLLGRRLEELYPLVPLAENTALGVAIMSYDGSIDFGLVSDYDALPDLEALAADLEAAILELADAAGVTRGAAAANGSSPLPRQPAAG